MEPDKIATIAALAVALVALLVASAQAIQQYFISGQLIRLCDSVVYNQLPGQGHRAWQFRQLRFRVVYSIPQIRLLPELWTFTVTRPDPLPSDAARIPSLISGKSRARLSALAGEASWASFVRTVQYASEDSLRYTMVEGDADRCPSDLPVVPMQLSMRDVVVLGIMAGMECTNVSFHNKSISMQGATGTIITSWHPILGALIHFAPKQSHEDHGIRMMKGRVDPAWVARMLDVVTVAGQQFDARDRRDFEQDEETWLNVSRRVDHAQDYQPVRVGAVAPPSTIRRRHQPSRREPAHTRGDDTESKKSQDARYEASTAGNNSHLIARRPQDGNWSFSPATEKSPMNNLAGHDTMGNNCGVSDTRPKKKITSIRRFFSTSKPWRQHDSLPTMESTNDQKLFEKYSTGDEEASISSTRNGAEKAANSPNFDENGAPAKDTRIASDAKGKRRPKKGAAEGLAEVHNQGKQQGNPRNHLQNSTDVIDLGQGPLLPSNDAVRSRRRSTSRSRPYLASSIAEMEQPSSAPNFLSSPFEIIEVLSMSAARENYFADKWQRVFQRRQEGRSRGDQPGNDERRLVLNHNAMDEVNPRSASPSSDRGRERDPQNLQLAIRNRPRRRDSSRKAGSPDAEGRSTTAHGTRGNGQLLLTESRRKSSDTDYFSESSSQSIDERSRSPSLLTRTRHSVNTSRTAHTQDNGLLVLGSEDTSSRDNSEVDSARRWRRDSSPMGHTTPTDYIRSEKRDEIVGSTFPENLQIIERHRSKERDSLERPETVPMLGPGTNEVNSTSHDSSSRHQREAGDVVESVPRHSTEQSSKSPTRVSPAIASPEKSHNLIDAPWATVRRSIISRLLVYTEQCNHISTIIQSCNWVGSDLYNTIMKIDEVTKACQSSLKELREMIASTEESTMAARVNVDDFNELLGDLGNVTYIFDIRFTSSYLMRMTLESQEREWKEILDNFETAHPSTMLEVLDLAHRFAKEIIKNLKTDTFQSPESILLRERLTKANVFRESSSKDEPPTAKASSQKSIRSRSQSRPSVRGSASGFTRSPSGPSRRRRRRTASAGSSDSGVRYVYEKRERPRYRVKINDGHSPPPPPPIQHQAYSNAIKWRWLCQVDVLPGFFATPWKSSCSDVYCTSAISIFIKTIEMMAGESGFHYVGSHENCKDWLRVGKSTYPSYAHNANGGVVVAGVYRPIVFDGFEQSIPPLTLLRSYSYQTSKPFHSTTDSVIDSISELMALDTWLSFAGRTPEIQQGRGQLLLRLPTLIQRIDDEFGFEFNNVGRASKSGGSRIVETVSKSLITFLEEQGFGKAERLFTLVGLLRAGKVELGVVRGVDTRELKDVLERDCQVWMA
ncbi:MAG: hypothetical protein Q9216_005864 [Gyalolechia sp. 2 TL-2023]